MNEVSIYLIPEWIRNTAEQKKLDYMDMLNYDKMRSMMSIEDVIDLYSLPNIFETVVSNLFTPYTRFNDTNNNPEYRNVIEPSLYSQDSIGRNRSRLTLPAIDMVDVNYDDVCTIKVINTKVIIVFIKPGFINVFGDLSGKLTLLRNMLKALYAVQPIHMVAQSPVYNLYLKTLLK